MRNFDTVFILSVGLLLLVSCAQKELLEPLSDNAPTVNVTEEANTNPNFRKLVDLLKERGYEGVGLPYESDSTLNFFYQVFSDARTANRQMTVFYSGLAMAYDGKNRSLTIGGANNPETAIRFIAKNVPLKAPSKEAH